MKILLSNFREPDTVGLCKQGEDSNCDKF